MNLPWYNHHKYGYSFISTWLLKTRIHKLFNIRWLYSFLEYLFNKQLCFRHHDNCSIADTTKQPSTSLSHHFEKERIANNFGVPTRILKNNTTDTLLKHNTQLWSTTCLNNITARWRQKNQTSLVPYVPAQNLDEHSPASTHSSEIEQQSLRMSDLIIGDTRLYFRWAATMKNLFWMDRKLVLVFNVRRPFEEITMPTFLRRRDFGTWKTKSRQYIWKANEKIIYSFIDPHFMKSRNVLSRLNRAQNKNKAGKGFYTIHKVRQWL